MKTEKIRRKSLDEMIDEHIGIKGTKERDIFEEELRLDILGQISLALRTGNRTQPAPKTCTEPLYRMQETVVQLN
jgi:hypothetical protein